LHLFAWLCWLLTAFLLGVVVGHSWRVGVGAAVATAVAFALFPQLAFKPQVRVLELLPEEIRTSIGSIRKILQWSEVAKIERDGDFIVITGRNGNAFLIPPMAFTDRSQIGSILLQLRAWHAGIVTPPAI
jgi:hypothetical protein